jgi:hypothetical protein
MATQITRVDGIRAELIDGKAIADTIRQELKAEVDELELKYGQVRASSGSTCQQPGTLPKERQAAGQAGRRGPPSEPTRQPACLPPRSAPA